MGNAATRKNAFVAWVLVPICIAFHLVRTSTCIPTPSLSLSNPLSSLDVSVSSPFHPFDRTQNTPTTNTTLTTWPPTPFGVPIRIPDLTTSTTLTIIATGRVGSAEDKNWLLAAIDYQQSVYREQGDHPQKFNIWNDKWRFYMELGETPLTMAVAVRTLQVYAGLVEAYGMAPMAFVLSVGEDVRGFYWVTVKNARVKVGVGAV